MSELTGKVALVTGASRGIGRAIAVALARAGADVAINYRTREDAARETLGLVAALGRRSLVVSADISVAAEITRLMAAVEAGLGPIDVLVNNAGVARPLPLEQVTEGDFDEMVAINLKSAFLLTQAVLPGMRARRWGRVINVSSAAAQVGGVVGPHYAASKAGLHGLIHAYAKLLVWEGITVNCIAPALIETEMVTSNPRAKPELIPFGRFGTAEEVADVVAMLATNVYITGQTINVNGGWYRS
jgi:3-oxoacyl-[acyl-carrier protein] reductase